MKLRLDKVISSLCLISILHSCKKEDQPQTNYSSDGIGGCPFESYPPYTGTFVMNLSQPDTVMAYVFNDTIHITGTVTGSGGIASSRIIIRQLSADSVIYNFKLSYSPSFNHDYIVPLTSTDSLSISVYYQQVNYSPTNCTEFHSIAKTVKVKVNI